ncbi:MAG: hypothetical protein LBF28_03365, partial [Rickettsiales bacterium]|nr:hypothetical protein [Rickettsiales bacterium]
AATTTAIAALISAGTGIYSAAASEHIGNKQIEEARKARDAAEEKQKQADFDAETKRLEALRKNQTTTASGYNSAFGIDSDYARTVALAIASRDDEENIKIPEYDGIFQNSWLT